MGYRGQYVREPSRADVAAGALDLESLRSFAAASATMRSKNGLAGASGHRSVRRRACHAAAGLPRALDPGLVDAADVPASAKKKQSQGFDHSPHVRAIRPLCRAGVLALSTRRTGSRQRTSDRRPRRRALLALITVQTMLRLALRIVALASLSLSSALAAHSAALRRYNRRRYRPRSRLATQRPDRRRYRDGRHPPSQTATSTHRCHGAFRFLSLAPDTYTLSLARTATIRLAAGCHRLCRSSSNV